MSELARIPQVQPWLGEEEASATRDVVAGNWLTEGPNCAEFSRRLCEFVGSPYGVFAPNGTLALAIALMALELQPGDEVLVPDITFIGSANAVIMAGGTPVFVDVEPVTFQMDLAQAEKRISPRTAAIMPVHLYGAAYPMTELVEFARRHRLLVIEDAAQGIGVYHRGRHTGTFGDVGCFSFFADKTITTGEGGFIVCNDEEIYQRLRLLRNQGRPNAGTFIHPSIGYNFRITDMQAAIGLVQLGKLDEIVRRKRAIYEWYQEELASLDVIRILGPAEHGNHVPFRCVIIAPRLGELMPFLEERGIQTRSFFYPMHRQPCFQAILSGDGSSPENRDQNFPVSLYGYDHGLCLPIFPTLTREQVSHICRSIREFYAFAPAD